MATEQQFSRKARAKKAEARYACGHKELSSQRGFLRKDKASQSARAFWRNAAFTCILAWLLPVALHVQNSVYVNNQSGVSNTISSFSVDTGGVLTSLGTVNTGSTGAAVACAGIDRITTNLARPLE